MTRGVFITGTDGVGKTRVGAALAHLLTGRGLRVRPRKPVESGCPTGPDGLLPQDAAVLRDAAGRAEPLKHICRYRLQAPLSPERATELEGMALDLGRLYTACLADIGNDNFLLVEGADGFYSPAGLVLNQPAPQADPQMSNAEDLERWLQIPVLRLPYGPGSGVEAWQQEAASLSRLADAWLAGTSLNRPCR